VSASRGSKSNAILTCLFFTIVIYIVLEASRDGIAAALFAPYATWVAFAGVLNAAIWRLSALL
jgi:tryptophan-rich sensory protein